MKILVLHPQVDAQHVAVRGLRMRGAAVIMASNGEDAWKHLEAHGVSIDLAIIHREAGTATGQPGISFVERVKDDKEQSDLPIILTSQVWSDVDFAKHQRTPAGVNAYLAVPYREEQLIQMIEAVLGCKLNDESGVVRAPTGGVTEAKPTEVPTLMTSVAVPENGAPKLEETAHIFRSEFKNPQATSIRLDSPNSSSQTGATFVPKERPQEFTVSKSTEEEAPLALEQSQSIAENAAAAGEPPELDATILASPEELAGAPESGSPSEATQVLSPEASSDNPHEQDTGPLDVVESSGPQLEMVSQSGEMPSIEMIEDTQEQPLPAAQVSVPEPAPNLFAAPAPASTSEHSPSPEDSAERELPYLFGKGAPKQGDAHSLADAALVAVAPPLGEALVPGGAAHAPDSDGLLRHLQLREQDVAVLSSQLRSARDQIRALETAVRDEQARNVMLAHENEEQKRRIDGFESEQAAMIARVQEEASQARFAMKSKADKAMALEAQVRAATEEMEKIRERVRVDIRKIRTRERELENRLEIAKKDSEALLAARENRIVELKRKLDLMEFNMDLLQDQFSREKERSAKLREKLVRAGQAVRVAGGLLDRNGDPVMDVSPDDLHDPDGGPKKQAS